MDNYEKFTTFHSDSSINTNTYTYFQETHQAPREESPFKASEDSGLSNYQKNNIKEIVNRTVNHPNSETTESDKSLSDNSRNFPAGSKSRKFSLNFSQSQRISSKKESSTELNTNTRENLLTKIKDKTETVLFYKSDDSVKQRKSFRFGTEGIIKAGDNWAQNVESSKNTKSFLKPETKASCIRTATKIGAIIGLPGDIVESIFAMPSRVKNTFTKMHDQLEIIEENKDKLEHTSITKLKVIKEGATDLVKIIASPPAQLVKSPTMALVYATHSPTGNRPKPVKKLMKTVSILRPQGLKNIEEKLQDTGLSKKQNSVKEK